MYSFNVFWSHFASVHVMNLSHGMAHYYLPHPNAVSNLQCSQYTQILFNNALGIVVVVAKLALFHHISVNCHKNIKLNIRKHNINHAFNVYVGAAAPPPQWDRHLHDFLTTHKAVICPKIKMISNIN
jgi:hypothetical protein